MSDGSTKTNPARAVPEAVRCGIQALMDLGQVPYSGATGVRMADTVYSLCDHQKDVRRWLDTRPDYDVVVVCLGVLAHVDERFMAACQNPDGKVASMCSMLMRHDFYCHTRDNKKRVRKPLLGRPKSVSLRTQVGRVMRRLLEYSGGSESCAGAWCWCWCHAPSSMESRTNFHL